MHEVRLEQGARSLEIGKVLSSLVSNINYGLVANWASYFGADAHTDINILESWPLHLWLDDLRIAVPAAKDLVVDKLLQLGLVELGGVLQMVMSPCLVVFSHLPLHGVIEIAILSGDRPIDLVYIIHDVSFDDRACVWQVRGVGTIKYVKISRIVEVGQQFAWLGAALQSSPFESGIARCQTIAKRSANKRSLMPPSEDF